MTNQKYVLSVALAAATFILVLPPFAESMKLVVPEIGPYLAQVGIVPGTEPAWIAPVVGIIAPALGALAFVASWKQKSFLVPGLLAAAGIVYITGTMLAVLYLFGPVIPGPILGAISGTGILGLGVAKGVRTAKAAVLETRQYE